jgi:hypothetical protein
MTTDRTESTRPGFAAPAAIRLLLILAVCACTTACAVSRPRLSPEDLESRIRVQEEGMARHLRKLVDRTVRRMEQEVEMQERGGPPAVFDILMISGGGDYGAFAAGVLEGWGEVGDAGWTRPTFDVVTGVSTGALIAPFALIGDENSYRRVLTLYENPKKDWIELRDIFFFLPGRQSFMSTAGLERDVREQIDAKTIAAIAAAERDGRTLAIGATNLDLGRMHPWDLTTEAARIEAGELESDRFYKVLMASAAIPALFPPVVIDDTLFVDGGDHLEHPLRRRPARRGRAGAGIPQAKPGAGAPEVPLLGHREQPARRHAPARRALLGLHHRGERGDRDPLVDHRDAPAALAGHRAPAARRDRRRVSLRRDPR